VELGQFTIAAPFIWIAAWVIASVLYRLKAGKPLFPRAPQNSVFSEAWVSGRSLKNVLTRFGGARNCLLVYVAEQTLTVVPIFPFNLMFVPELLGLEMTVPARLIGIEQVDGLLGKRLRLSVKGQIQEQVELSLRNPAGFQEAMAAVDAASTSVLTMAGMGERKGGWRFGLARVFLVLWGLVVLIIMSGQLKLDYQFRRDGIAAAATMVSHTGQTGSRGDNGILQYSVRGRPYTIVSHQGTGVYEIGATAQVHYLPTDPSTAREDGQQTFDLIFALAGVFALVLGLTLGRLTGFIARNRTT